MVNLCFTDGLFACERNILSVHNCFQLFVSILWVAVHKEKGKQSPLVREFTLRLHPAHNATGNCNGNSIDRMDEYIASFDVVRRRHLIVYLSVLLEGKCGPFKLQTVGAGVDKYIFVPRELVQGKSGKTVD